MLMAGASGLEFLDSSERAFSEQNVSVLYSSPKALANTSLCANGAKRRYFFRAFANRAAHPCSALSYMVTPLAPEKRKTKTRSCLIIASTFLLYFEFSKNRARATFALVS